MNTHRVKFDNISQTLCIPLTSIQIKEREYYQHPGAPSAPHPLKGCYLYPPITFVTLDSLVNFWTLYKCDQMDTTVFGHPTFYLWVSLFYFLIDIFVYISTVFKENVSPVFYICELDNYDLLIKYINTDSVWAPTICLQHIQQGVPKVRVEKWDHRLLFRTPPPRAGGWDQGNLFCRLSLAVAEAFLRVRSLASLVAQT